MTYVPSRSSGRSPRLVLENFDEEDEDDDDDENDDDDDDDGNDV
tara:strand:+ start:271 stop:402 length:132 start_codon:yes stop_codon:yes gene_type:complete